LEGPSPGLSLKLLRRIVKRTLVKRFLSNY